MNQTEHEVFDASTLQKGMIYYSSIDNRYSTYQDTFSYQIQDTLDVVLFAQSIEQVCQIHPMLQAAFSNLETSSPKIVVYQNVKPPVQVLDKTSMDPSLQKSCIKEWMALEHQNKINIIRPPLIRFTLHKFAYDQYHFGFTFHHAILDGWSVASLFVEINACYQALKNGRPYTYVPLTSTFRSYVEHERKALEDKHQKVFWQQNLRGYIPSKPTLLPVEAKEDETMLGGVVNYHSPINQTEFAQLRNVASKLNVPIRTILLSVHMAVVSYFLNSKDIVSGYVASTRLEEENAQYTKGVFLNTLPFRLKVTNDITWSNFIRSVYESELDIIAHRFYPLAQIQQDNGYDQIIDIVFSFVQFHIYDGFYAHETNRFIKLEVFEKTNFDLMINFYGGHAAKLPHFDIEYNPEKYSATMIRSLANCYRQAMQNLIFGLEEGVFAKPYLKKQNLKLDFDNLRESATLILKFESVIEMFNETAKNCPFHIAIETDEKTLSYLELYTKVSAIANYLVLQGVRKNQSVVLYGGRSIDYVAAILAIMSLGAIYVPIDVYTPQGRVAKIVSQLTDFRVLTTKLHRDTFQEHADSLIFFEGVSYNPDSQAHIDIWAESSDTAYILFTSGSTGEPKGVVVDHRALLLRSMWFIQHFAPAPDDKYAHYTSYSFDVSLEEVLIPLISGATLYVMPDSIAYDPIKFMKIVNDVNITFIETVPTFLHNLLKHNAFSKSSKLRHVIVGGESLDVALVHDFYQQCDIPLWNLYGPTETVINASYFDCREITISNGKVVPIGKPIANTNIFLLNIHKQPIIAGTVGEIYISGDGVAQGYLNTDESDNSFMNLTPYSPKNKPIRLYQTGDLGRLLPCGNIEFLGRVDSQVKHNGIRVELDEIEACIKQVEGIDMVVVKQEHIEGQQYLVAYLKLHNMLQDCEHQHFLKNLQKIVARDVPRQVIPSYYAILETMPLLPSLKINKRALTHQNYPLNRVITCRVLPRNEVEEKLEEIWLSLLGVNTISVYDNFFSLGGTSFDVTQLLYLIKQEFNASVDAQTFLKQPTIASLAKLLVKPEVDLSSDNPQFDKDLSNIQSMSLDSSVLPQPVTNASHILVTGATGYIGSYLLQELLAQTNAIIYCLVRLEDMALALQQLVDTLPSTFTLSQISRIVPVNGDLAKPRLGMASDVYARLLSKVDMIYHAGAKVNHLLDYAQLRTVNYLGSLEVLKFATTERNKKIVYLSSLSAVAPKSNKIPETFVSLNPSNVHGGYNQSKWMTEAMFAKSASLGAMLSIYRLGSIIGDTKTCRWRQSNNHFLSLIAGCIQLGVAPDWPFTFDLLPVNKVAQFIVSASLNAKESELLNVGASCPALWRNIIQALQTDYNIRLISQKEWLDHYLPQVDKTNPIYPLLAFYQKEFEYDETCETQIDMTQFQARSKALGIEKIEILIDEFKALVLAALGTQTSLV